MSSCLLYFDRRRTNDHHLLARLIDAGCLEYITRLQAV